MAEFVSSESAAEAERANLSGGDDVNSDSEATALLMEEAWMELEEEECDSSGNGDGYGDAAATAIVISTDESMDIDTAPAPPPLSTLSVSAGGLSLSEEESDSDENGKACASNVGTASALASDGSVFRRGCEHYRRGAALVSPCCGEIFACRVCHDLAKYEGQDLKVAHKFDRFNVKEVVCLRCEMRQPWGTDCIHCGLNFGTYSCKVCKFFDDDGIQKKAFHCDKCGLCRIGGAENFFHCDKCGVCLSIQLKGSHPCVEQAMNQNCPICLEYLFTSREPVTVLEKCGHTIHLECMKQMLQTGNYKCPTCNKSMVNMSEVWARMDEEMAATPMPPLYVNTWCCILCNDCGQKSESRFHVGGLKCGNSECGSWNTRKVEGQPVNGPLPSEVREDNATTHQQTENSSGGGGGSGANGRMSE